MRYCNYFIYPNFHGGLGGYTCMLTKLVPFMYFIVHLLFHNKKILLKIKCYFKINFLNFKPKTLENQFKSCLDQKMGQRTKQALLQGRHTDG